METSFETYVDRINSALKSIVMPEVASPLAQSQLLMIMELLNQWRPRLQYRHDLLVQDLEWVQEALRPLLKALSDGGIRVPEDITEAAEIKLTTEVYGKGLQEEVRCVQAAASKALDLLYAHSDQIEDIDNVQRTVFRSLRKSAERDAMMMRTALSG